MIRATKVIGLKVITKQTGEVVEEVDDVLYSAKDHRVYGLLVKPKGLLNDAKVILMNDIENIGPDAIIIRNDAVIRDAKTLPTPIGSIAKSDRYLTQTKIVSETGTELGTISDIIFNLKDGQVHEFEISQGALQNVASGKKIIHPDDIITIGKDATIVKSFTEAEIAAQAESGGAVGTIKQAATTAKAKSQAAVEAARSKTESAKNDPHNQQRLEAVKSTITDLGSQARAKASNVTTQIEEVSQHPRAEKAQKAARGVLEKAKQKLDEALDNAATWADSSASPTSVKGGKKSVTTQVNSRTSIAPGTTVTIKEEDGS